jgi:hypothetical protein
VKAYPLVFAPIRIGINIIRIASAGDIDMEGIADRLVLPRLDDGAAAPCICPPGAPANGQTLFIDTPQ